MGVVVGPPNFFFEIREKAKKMNTRTVPEWGTICLSLTKRGSIVQYYNYLEPEPIGRV